MSIADTTELAILKLIFNATAWANYADNAASSPQTNTDIALSTADPGDAGTMSTSEATYTSYARQSPLRSATGWTVSGTSPCQAVLTSAVNFPAGTGGAGTVTNFSVGKTGGGAVATLFTGMVTPNVVTGNGITPQLTTATVCTLD